METVRKRLWHHGDSVVIQSSIVFKLSIVYYIYPFYHYSKVLAHIIGDCT